MKSLPFLLVLAPAGALAASSFDGTWAMRPGSYHELAQPYVFTLDQNEFRCQTCVPPWSVKPDGQFHTVSGDGYDSIAARIVDPRTAEVRAALHGKELVKQTEEASQDGEHLRETTVIEIGERPSTRYYTYKRSAGTKAGEGKHAASGSWLLTGRRDPKRIVTTFKMTDDAFSWAANGQHFEAKFDGEPVATEGDPAHTMVSVKKLSATEVHETDTRNGATVDEYHYAISPDGKSIKVTEKDPRSGHGSDYVLERAH